MIFKSFKQDGDGMTYFKFLRDHLGYRMDNGLAETVQQGNDGRHTGEKWRQLAWNRVRAVRLDAT